MSDTRRKVQHRRRDNYKFKIHGSDGAFDEAAAAKKQKRPSATQTKPNASMEYEYSEDEFLKQLRLDDEEESKESARIIAEEKRLDEQERIKEEQATQQAIARAGQWFVRAKRAAGIVIKVGDRLMTRAESAEYSRLIGGGMTEVQAIRVLGRNVQSNEVIDCSKLADLKEAPARRPIVVEGVLRAGEVADFVASSKIGKSWSMLQFLLSIAAGVPWLGKFATKQGHVLLVDNELHKEELKHRVWRIAGFHGRA